ncbi:MAG: peptidoglycan DD-metalloendopeptidase family protein [Chloroflexi bacterium]|nr:peptidoglycan DD-metalloendopeptidase family protein [Chloroflexota bacterium]
MRFAPPHYGRLVSGVAFCFLPLAIAAFLLVRPSAQANEQPEFLLPWQHGETWLTGGAGFHNANNAIDFFPPDTPLSIGIKCEGDPDWVFEESAYYVLSSAPGVVVQASNASVLIDHGGGWLSRHYHMTGFVVEADDFVAAGQRLARPSTLGFCSSGPHNHFWIQGPDGETTADVMLSTIPATEIGVNEYIGATFNFETGGGASPPPAPTATPSGPPRGDANCDGGVNANDATTVLWIIVGYTDPECGTVTADTDCDGVITTADVLNILLHVPALSVLPAAVCPTPTPEPTPLPSPTMIPDDTPAPTPTPPSQ